MLIAVISDTHMPRGQRRLPDACVERLGEADLILHAGDVASASTLAEFELIGPPVLAVHGNQDDAELCRRLPVERTVEADGGPHRDGARRRPADGRLRACGADSPKPTPWCSATPTCRCTSSATDSRSSTPAAPPTAAARPRTPWASPA